MEIERDRRRAALIALSKVNGLGYKSLRSLLASGTDPSALLDGGSAALQEAARDAKVRVTEATLTDIDAWKDKRLEDGFAACVFRSHLITCSDGM